MTDAQLAVLVSAAAALGTGFGKLLWSMFTSWIKEREADRVERKADRDADRLERREDRAASLEVVRGMTKAVTEIAERVSSLERVVDRNAERVERATTGTHEIPPEPLLDPPQLPPRRTPGGGIPLRAATERPYDPRKER